MCGPFCELEAHVCAKVVDADEDAQHGEVERRVAAAETLCAQVGVARHALGARERGARKDFARELVGGKHLYM